MPLLNQITNPNKLTQRKVNFFADYFLFVTNQIGSLDTFEIENIKSLIEKIIFQIQNNLNHCPKYLNSYLTNPLLHRDNKFFKEYKGRSNLMLFFEEYNNAGGHEQKVKWIKTRPEFLTALVKFKAELKRKMFKKALKSIISYLKCKHDFYKHENHIIHYTKILVSEFLINERAKGDIGKVFEKIITREVKTFPFPKSLIQKNKKGNIEEAKKLFIQNRTLDQQFEGIYNLLTEQTSKHYFIFRIYGITAEPKFSFKYNKVTFLSKRSPKLKLLIKNTRTENFMKHFFSKRDMMLAVVRVNYYSTEIAVKNAINFINDELVYLNEVCQANGYLEKYSYLITANFKTFGGRWSRDELAHLISESDSSRVRDNPYNILRRISFDLKNHFLKYEPLFIRAVISHDISDYWRYLEALIPLKDNDEKQVVEVVSLLLLLNAESFYKNSISNYLNNLITHFDYPPDLIGISREQQDIYYNKYRTKHSIDLKAMKSKINHPFLNHLFKLYDGAFTKNDFQKLNNFYKRVLWETQAQRNSIIHQGNANDKALIFLYGTLPRLTMRFRWVLFDGMKRKLGNNFTELIGQLKKEAHTLISK